MKTSREDTDPAATITHDGTPTIFSFLTSSGGSSHGSAVPGAGDRLESDFESLNLRGDGQIVDLPKPDTGKYPAALGRALAPGV